MLLTLIRWLWYVKEYLLNVFTSVLFITSGKRIRKIILLYCVISIYDMITQLCLIVRSQNGLDWKDFAQPHLPMALLAQRH